MTEHTILYLSGLKALTVLLGFLIVWFGFKAWRAGRRRPLLWLTLGMGLMTLGAIAEGVAFQGLGLTLDESHIVEALFTLAAFGVLVYSLYAS